MSIKMTADRRRQLAEIAGLDEQYLYQCLTGRRDMEPGRARAAEESTNGELRRQDLCQKTWQRIWPELAATAAPAPTLPPPGPTDWPLVRSRMHGGA